MPLEKSNPLYNIACCEALLGNTDSALSYLAQAISHGFRNVQHIEQDKDLISLRGLEAFELLLSELRSQKPAEKRPHHRREGNEGCHRKEGEGCHWKDWRDSRKCNVQTEGETNNTNDETPVHPIGNPMICKKRFRGMMRHNTMPILPVSQPITAPVTEPVAIPVVPVEPIVPVVPNPQPITKIEEPKAEEPVMKCETYEMECNALVQMGFTNKKKNMRTLMKTKGNLTEAVALLLR